ncbi:MBL fold metallo-hydrolase [bacterium 210820-DFI.6.37]|nr:MBL fold metallo-hydrolase [bacterium 210820-DFI.6.37]
MIIHRYVSDLLQSNMYVLEECGHAIVIDPCNNIDPGRELCIDKIILTHEHYDHISGVNAWKEAYHTNVLCSKICAKNIINPKKNMARYFDIFCEIQNWVEVDWVPDTDSQYTCMAEETFDDETFFLWQEHNIQLFSLPGHTMGSIGVLVDDIEFFSGDSVMENAPVELRFPGGSAKSWREISLPRLELLPDSLYVHPGHFKEFFLRKGG